MRTEEAYAAALAAVRAHAAARVLVVVEAVEPVLALAAQVRRTLGALERGGGARTAATRADVRAQLDSLVRPGFVAATGVDRLRDVQRYLRADAAPPRAGGHEPARGRCSRRQVDGVGAGYADLLDSLPATRRGAAEVTDIGWMVEESCGSASSPRRSGRPARSRRSGCATPSRPSPLRLGR